MPITQSTLVSRIVNPWLMLGISLWIKGPVADMDEKRPLAVLRQLAPTSTPFLDLSP